MTDINKYMTDINKYMTDINKYSIINRYGFYCIPKSKSNDMLYEKLLKDLNIKPTKKYGLSKSRLYMNNDEPICCLFETKLYWNIPRFYGIDTFGLPIENKIYNGIDLNENIKFNGSLYEEQKVPIEYVLKQFRKNDYENGGLLGLPCGEGKTVSAIYIISSLMKKTIIIVHKEFLMNQWVNEIKTFLPNANIGIIQGDRCEIENSDIVLAMIQTLSKRDYEYDIIKDFGFAIYDECHHLGAKMFSKVLLKIPCKYLLGLSAEPLRKDGMNLVFEYYLGKTIFQRERNNETNVFVHRFLCSSDSDYYKEYFDKRGEKQLYKMEENVVSFNKRNNLIVHILINLFSQFDNRQILLLSARNEGHLPKLYELIEKSNICHSNGKKCSIGFYIGRNGVNKKRYAEILDTSSKCDIILGTYDMAMEGLNIKSLNTIMLASPLVGLQKQNVNGVSKIFCNDIKQTIGRILRDKYSKQQRIVFDIVDLFGNYIEWSRQRVSYYKKEKYILFNQDIQLDNIYNNKPIIDYNWIKNYNSNQSIHSICNFITNKHSQEDEEFDVFEDENTKPLFEFNI